jgi:hypothetical protein
VYTAGAQYCLVSALFRAREPVFQCAFCLFTLRRWLHPSQPHHCGLVALAFLSYSVSKQDPFPFASSHSFSISSLAVSSLFSHNRQTTHALFCSPEKEHITPFYTAATISIFSCLPFHPPHLAHVASLDELFLLAITANLRLHLSPLSGLFSPQHFESTPAFTQPHPASDDLCIFEFA